MSDDPMIRYVPQANQVAHPYFETAEEEKAYTFWQHFDGHPETMPEHQHCVSEKPESHITFCPCRKFLFVFDYPEGGPLKGILT